MSRQRPPPRWLSALAEPDGAPSQALLLEQLRAAILAGRVPPGAPLPLDDVAAHFALSRIPVREALTTLVAEGLVGHEPRGAYVVSTLTRQELAELYLVRASLEATALAAAVPRIADSDVRTAATALDDLTAAVLCGDGDGLRRGTRAFHLALLAPCRMQRLLGIFEATWNVTEPGRPMVYASPQLVAALADDHAAMLGAFRERDAARLLALNEVHYVRLQAVVAQYPELPEQ